MKIGFDAKRAFFNNRGLGNYSRDLIRILKENTTDELVLFSPKKKHRKDFLKEEDFKLITPKGFLKKIKSLWRMWLVSNEIKKEKLDIFHGLSGEIPIGSSRYTNTIVTIHDLIFMRFPHLYSFFDKNIHYYKFLYAAKKSKHIIAISEQTKQDIVKFLKVPEEKISVVYQGCHKAFKEEISEEVLKNVKEKYALPQKFVLCVGAIEERKNALEIVKAIKEIDIPLVLVGKKTKYFSKIEDFCRNHHLKNKVIVLENLPMQEIACVYRLATIFCYPSVFEGFGIPIIEALFSRVPVITSKGSCFAEAGGEHSIYVDIDENTSISIKKNIEMLLSDAEKRQKMIEEGYKHAQNFTDKAVFENLYKVYQKVRQSEAVNR